MIDPGAAGTYPLGGGSVRRLGYGAMRLSGPGIFGPPADPATAIAILRTAVDNGVDHIDTSDFYGPHVTNQLIRQALHPYRDDLVIVTKVGAARGSDGAWLPAFEPERLEQAVHDNLRHLGLEVLDVVNLRLMFDVHAPAEGSIEAPLSTLAELKQRGLIRHLGLSHVTPTQIAEGRRITEIACVQNAYNLVQRRDDDLIDALAATGTAYVPYFPLGGFTPLKSAALDSVARSVGASAMQVALAWLLQRSPNLLLIPGTSSLAHLNENLGSAGLVLPPDAVATLDSLGSLKDGDDNPHGNGSGH